jgi:hypothetical protein
MALGILIATLLGSIGLMLGIIAYFRLDGLANEIIARERISPPRTTWGVVAIASRARGSGKWIVTLVSVMIAWAAVVAFWLVK